MSTPTSIGKYEIIKVLGTGSSATVYLARDTFSQAQVALKVIDPGVLKGAADSQSLRAQFLREASLAGRLQHPHIVAILDAVVNEDVGYIAMEYVPGGSLAPRVKPQDLFSIEDAIQVGFKCCGALDYAFRQGIVHRDVKPANIMVVKDTDIKIGDFGAAHLRKNETVVTMNVGSPAYMSPEQIAQHTLTHQSDMFSVGIVLYELLTGQRPFAGATLDAVLNNVMKVDPVRPSQVRPELPPELDAIVLKALQKTPAARYTTWAEFALDLAKVGKLSFKEQTIRDSEKFEALRKVELLQRFNDAELWELVHAGRWKRVNAQSAIVREHDLGQSLFFLARGQAKATRQGRMLNSIGAGEFFGEMAYIRGGEIPRQATVETLTEVLYAEFQSTALEKMSAASQLHLTRALVRTLVERLEFANDRIAQAFR